jgi:histidyl-tRNA synthetase
MKYRIAKGVFDILPIESDPQSEWRRSHLWNFIESIARNLAQLYGLSEVRTPLFESTELFQRSIGQTTDIVTKEMYTFQDLGGRSITLRPEGTAPVMRAFIEKHLDQLASKHKFFYLAPMFRYERQQAGRYRQHHQFGVEVIGESSPFQDVEVIEILHTFYSSLGLRDLTVYLNSLGTPQCRLNFREALKDFLRPRLLDLSEDSQRRFEQNPLRILDSKEPQDIEILKNAPSILNHLSEKSLEHFDAVQQALKENGIPFEINTRLVRGLDYYNHTVFEITSGALGAQNSLGGGGRYDSLIKELGGPDLPAVGFGTGIERVLQACLAQGCILPKVPTVTLQLLPMGNEALRLSFKLASELRASGVSCDVEYKVRKLKNSLKSASQAGIAFVGIIGEQEIAKGVCTLKNMKEETTEEIPLSSLVQRFKA